MALHQLLYRGSACSSCNGLRSEWPLFHRHYGPPGSAPSSITEFTGHREGGGWKGGGYWWQRARQTPAKTRWLATTKNKPHPLPTQKQREDKWGGGGLKIVKGRSNGGTDSKRMKAGGSKRGKNVGQQGGGRCAATSAQRSCQGRKENESLKGKRKKRGKEAAPKQKAEEDWRARKQKCGRQEVKCKDLRC